jgi:hypothetical protein
MERLPCARCKRRDVPLQECKFSALGTFLLFIWESERHGNYCRRCGVLTGLRCMLLTLLAGWWGIGALSTLPDLLWNALGIVSVCRSSRLP